jgi:hypothetical protein
MQEFNMSGYLIISLIRPSNIVDQGRRSDETITTKQIFRKQDITQDMRA